MSETRNGAALIAAERERQKAVEGWTPEHDDEHSEGALVRAAESYLIAAEAPALRNLQGGPPPTMWPFDEDFWKPSPDPVRNLVKAGALIAAEIDRLQRAALYERDGVAEPAPNEEERNGGN
jgi:hypothetical protein